MARPIGSLNKSTRQIKEAFALLLVSKMDKLSIWIDKLGEENQAEAARLLIKMSAFFLPSANKITDFKIANPCHPEFMVTDDDDTVEIPSVDHKESFNSSSTGDEMMSKMMEAARDNRATVELAAEFGESIKDLRPDIYKEVLMIIESKTADSSANAPRPNRAERRR